MSKRLLLLFSIFFSAFSNAFGNPELPTHSDIRNFFLSFSDYLNDQNEIEDLEINRLMERTLRLGVCYGLSHIWVYNESTLIKLNQWIEENKKLIITPQYNSLFNSKKNEISQVLQEILSAQKAYHPEFLNRNQTADQKESTVQNKESLITLTPYNTGIINKTFGSVQITPSEVIPEHYTQEIKYFLSHDALRRGYTGYTLSAEDALLGLSQDQITEFIIYIKYRLKLDADSSLDYRTFFDQARCTIFQYDKASMNLQVQHMEEKEKALLEKIERLQEKKVQFLEKVETILQTLPKKLTVTHTEEETADANTSAVQKVLNHVYVEIQKEEKFLEHALSNKFEKLFETLTQIESPDSQAPFSKLLQKHCISLKEKGVSNVVRDLICEYAEDTMQAEQQDVSQQQSILKKKIERKKQFISRDGCLASLQEKIRVQGSKLQTALQTQYPEHTRHVENYTFPVCVRVKENFSSSQYYALFTQRLAKSLEPSDVKSAFLGIHIDYPKKLLNPTPIMSYEGSALSYANHAVSIKKVSPKTWAFYDCNLGTAQHYETLDALIETSLKPYFAPGNLHNIGTPYAIEVVRQTAQPQESEPLKENASIN